MRFAQGGNPVRSKSANQSAILRMIYLQGPITRPDIADQLELTRPTITTTVKTMIEKGIVAEVESMKEQIAGEASSAPGRRAYPVDIVPDSKFFVGVEMRGTHRAVCITDYRGNVVYQNEDLTICQDYATNMELTGLMILRAMNESAVPRSRIAGVGFCVPGLVDNDSGILEIHPGYNWKNKNLREDLRRRIGYNGPISVSNNACARAQAAQLFRKEGTLGDSFAYLFISIGIACPMMLNVATPYGSMGVVGEIGHIVMDPTGPRCSCGNHGCLEAYSSNHALLTRFQKLIDAGEAPLLAQICGSAPLSMNHLLQAQAQGDPTVCQGIREALEKLGIGIANICNFANPSTLFIEGDLFLRKENQRLFLDVVDKNFYGATHAHTDFIFLTPDTFSGAIGAAAVAIAEDLENYQE